MATITNAINLQNCTFGNRTITTVNDIDPTDKLLLITNGISLNNSTMQGILDLEFDASIVGGQLVLSAFTTDHLRITNPYAETIPPPGDVYDTYNFPIGGTGTSGQFLQLTTPSDTSTAQVVNWASPGGYTIVPSLSPLTLTPNTNYLVPNLGDTATLNMPATAAQGTFFTIADANISNGTLIELQTGQTVVMGDQTSSSGGTLSTIGANYTAFTLLCIVADTNFMVVNSQGNLSLN